MRKNHLSRRDFLKAMALCSAASNMQTNTWGYANTVSKKHPNIVYILIDDLGYGDLSCLNENSKVQTPHMDTLAKEGMIFTDAHSGSAVCTPTRYGVLTGRYCWRSKLKKGVLTGYDSNLIPPERLTVASLLKKHNYSTACIGKWHLGFDWGFKGSQHKNGDSVDFSKPIQNGPNSLGFDYFFGISASLDMPPYVYIENNHVSALPAKETENPDYQEFWRKGPTGADFKHIEVLDKLLDKVVDFIGQQGSQTRPFFLYFVPPAPHTPILPTKTFQGKSGTNKYGDFVLQVDWTVGQVMKALQEKGFVENTLVIVTSDNGCSPRARFQELAEFGHYPSYHFRGAKADIFEGGHRIPFIARWPGKIEAGSRCDDTICLTDLMATVAAIVDETLPDNAGEDSVSILPDLFERAKHPLREATVHHSINGSFSIRQGKWKLSLCPGSGGWSHPLPPVLKAKGAGDFFVSKPPSDSKARVANKDEMIHLPPLQLYDLDHNVGEKTNVQAKHPGIVRHLVKLLEKYVADGRSTPGTPQENDGEVKIWHQGTSKNLVR